MSKPNAIRQLNIEHPSNKPIEFEMVTVTPDLAAEWLGKNHGNRNQRSMRIDLYARDIIEGRWLVTGETIKFDWSGRLIDGQHRLEAVVAAKKPITILVVRNLDPSVQSVLDTNARRSAADALGFRGVDSHRSIIATHAKIATSRANGKLAYALDTEEPALSNGEVLDWYAANPDVEYSAAAASRAAKRTNTTPGALSYIFLTLSRVDSNAAVQFLTDIENLRTDGEGDPRFALIRALELQVSGRQRRTNAAQISLWFRAWNAWRSNRKLRSMPLSGSNTSARGVEIPEVI